MKTVHLGELPPGAQVRGCLFDDPTHVYGLGDVLEVELANGLMIDVGWDEEFPDALFRVVVYRDYFGDRLVDFRVRNLEDVVSAVQRLAVEYSHPCSVTDCSEPLQSPVRQALKEST